MKGYKGFSPGLVCRGKQYAENTVFEEDSAEICKSGMHFCENPFDVLKHYGFVDGKCELNEFAEVEALDESKTDDGKKYCTQKLKIGAKIGIPGLANAFAEYTLSRVNCSERDTGDCSAAINTGDCSAAINTGDWSAAKAGGVESFAISTGIDGKACGKIGCYIAVAEWVRTGTGHKLADFRTAMVDGEKIKEDTFYSLKNGEFVEVDSGNG